MQQIVNRNYFSKTNGLNIPLAIDVPTAFSSTASPSNSEYLDNLCFEIEKSLLLNSLGLNLYKDFQLALADIDNVVNEKWKFLLEGQEYEGKIWHGLKHDYNFIAQKIYETYITRKDEHLTMVGNVKVNSQNATVVTPVYKIANSNQSFIKQYQGGYMIYPDVYSHEGVNLVDYYGIDNQVEVSFYQYLLDKSNDFPTWDLSKFKVYQMDDVKNSFGL